MSTESDYSYKNPSTQTAGPSILLPFALLTVALAIVMITQTTNVFKARSGLRDGKAQLIEAYKAREPMVKQSADLQAKLQAMVLDLLLLAKTDDDAKAIVGKYNIQQNLPPGSSETPAPPAEPAK